MALINLCKNERCSRPVPPSKNKGVPRKYCSLRCCRAANARRYTARRAAEEKRARAEREDHYWETFDAGWERIRKGEDYQTVNRDVLRAFEQTL